MSKREKPATQAGSKPSSPKSRRSNPSQPLDDKPAGTQSLDKIRDILFGAQAQDYESRFAELEKRLIKEFSETRREFEDRLESLEDSMKKELETLKDLLNAEKKDRRELAKETSKRFADASRNLQKLDDELTESQERLQNVKADRSVVADLFVQLAERLTSYAASPRSENRDAD